MFDRYSEIKNGTCAGGALNRKLAPHQEGIGAAYGESQARPLVVPALLLIELIERLEQLLLLVFRNAQTGVLDAG